jgi:hypothetical protein
MHDAGDNSHAFMLEHSEDPQNERGSCITQSLGPLVPWSLGRHMARRFILSTCVTLHT